MADRHSFIFRIADLQQLVERHTSYLGKMRVTDKDLDAADRLSLTEGEDFLFADYLEEATSETYDWIKAFGRNVKDAFLVFPDGEFNVIKEHSGVTIQRDGVSYGERKAFDVLDMNPYIGEQDEVTHTHTLEVDPSPSIKIAVGDATSVTYVIRLYYTASVVGTNAISSQYIKTITNTITSDATISEIETTSDAIPQTHGLTVVTSIDKLEIEVTSYTPASASYNKGSYVKYIRLDGSFVYARLAAAYNAANKVEPELKDVCTDDPRGSVVMAVELPDWQDRNMLPAVERYLKDAIAFYIIWRWLETTNPKEAENYYNKYEEKAHQAQLGLNSEATILKRHGHWG